MFNLAIDHASVQAIVAMSVFMIWYWLIAYKYDVMSLAFPLAFLFVILPLTFLIVGSIALALSSAIYPTVVTPGFVEIETIRYLPFGAALLVIITWGAVVGSALVDGSKISEEKHKIWYVAIAYQVTMITHVLTGW